MITDAKMPNLFVGKIIENSHLQGEVISFDENNIQMKIIFINDKYYERYLDLGIIYPLFKHKQWINNLLLWEVEPKYMKRDTCQFLLQWEEDIGWSWDLCS